MRKTRIIGKRVDQKQIAARKLAGEFGRGGAVDLLEER
jgi:hypothetical protein